MTRRGLRPAAIAGGLTAVFVIALYAIRPLPFTVLRLLGVHGGLDLHGGMAMTYVLPPGADVDAVIEDTRRRLDEYNPGASVRVGPGGALELEIPGVGADEIDYTAAVLTQGGVQFREVLEDAPVMRQLFALAERDPRAAALGVRASPDTWTPEQGERRTDYYLSAAEPDAIIRFVEQSGIAIPDGQELLFEHIEPDAGRDEDREGYWRSYLVSTQVELDGSSIVNAVAINDPTTYRVIVMIDFDRDGAARFGDLTERLVGDKLATVLGGRVASAPIINGPIHGGRCSVTMSAGSLEAQEREAAALVAALRFGPLPPDGEVRRAEYVAPTVTAARLWLARGLLGVLAGAFAFGLIFVVAPRTERRPAIAGAPARPKPLAALFVTLTAPLAVYVAWNIPMPAINDIELQNIVYRGNAMVMSELGAFALRLGPLIAAFIVVELAALAVPSWRAQRLTPAGRRRLGRAVIVVAVAISAVQALLFAELLAFAGPDLHIIAPGGLSVPIIMVTCVGATLCLGLVAGAISEHGLGNGFSALIASGVVIELFAFLTSEVDPLPGLAIVVLAAATIAGVAVAVGWLVTRQVRDADGTPVAPPVAGLVPLWWPVGIAAVLGAAELADLEVVIWLQEASRPTTLTDHAVFAIVALGLTVGLGWVLVRPDRLAAVRARMIGGAAGAGRRAWLWATAPSALVIVALYVAAVALAEITTAPLLKLTGIAVVTAVVIDHVAEWRARRRMELVGVWPVHQAAMADVAVDVLAHAGIPAHLRGRHHRSLLHVFGPFVPIEVMVAPEHAGTATTLLRDMFDPASRGVTTAW